jgi:Zn-dependent M28 family amino/carboxypeptidase
MRPPPSLSVALVLAALAACSSSSASSNPSASASVAEAPSAAPSASAAASASASARVDALTGSALHKDATFLASPEFRGRGSGSEDEARAATWLAEQLDAAKVDKAFGERVVPFKYSRGKSANVVGMIGPEKSEKGYVLVGAHYDHVGVDKKGNIYFGAEDNASGTAMVLGLARMLVERKAELDRSVIIAFFGAEEHGLHGSHAFAKKWPHKERPISMMINIDMIGRTLVDQPLLWLGARSLGILSDVDPETAVGALLTSKHPEVKSRVVAACEPEGVRAIIPDDLPPDIRKRVEDMSRGRSDHYPFELLGIPFVFFSSGESTDYHEPTDTADKLEPAVLERRARAILRLIVAESRR